MHCVEAVLLPKFRARGHYLAVDHRAHGEQRGDLVAGLRGAPPTRPPACIISTRILGRRTAPFSPFLTAPRIVQPQDLSPNAGSGSSDASLEPRPPRAL